MSADGYFRIPRRLATAAIAPERVAALLWIVSQASYAPREVDGVPLDIGETPPIAASEFEKRYRWTRKTVRVFLDYALSDRCAEETGIRLRIGKKSKGPGEGPGEGPGLGPSKGPTVKNKVVEEGSNSPLRGESREGESENGTAPRKRAVPKPLPDEWMPSPNQRQACEDSGIDVDAVAEDFRFYWRETKGTKANWDLTFTKRIAAVRSTGKFRVNGNGRHATSTGITSTPDDAVAAAILERMRS